MRCLAQQHGLSPRIICDGQPLVTTGCGYLPIGYLPTGYLPTGYLPIGAAATGGGSLRGKSAAAATPSMATSPAVTIITIFMMLIPLCCSPGRADRVTPLFAPLASSSRAAPSLHSQSFADHGAARYNILNKALTAIRRETEFRHGPGAETASAVIASARSWPLLKFNAAYVRLVAAKWFEPV